MTPHPRPVPHIGIGGWDYAPWRGRFYPADLPKARELAYASSRLTSIEVNATFYRTQSRDSFIRWRDTVPNGFVFALKASRAAAYARDPDKLAASIAWFLASGLLELGDRLGPILWQFPASRRFDPAQVAAFVAALPTHHEGVALRHVIEAKHPSFADPAHAAILRARNVAACIVETADQPARAELTADFAYLRLQQTRADAPEGYDSAALDRWAAWMRSHAPALPGGVHTYFISGDKERAPDAAVAMLGRFGFNPPG